MRGLVLEGGSMRGLFSCGVIDVMMENDITFDGAIGVSAGAAFGCNIKSKQIGRGIRYNKQYCNDKRYASISNLVKTGDIFGKDFCYHTLPFELDIFDQETYASNPMEFYVVCTDCVTGKAVYHNIKKGDEHDVQWIRASASIPLLSNVVDLDGRHLLDGGIADSIPLEYWEKKGYEKNVVILTQPYDYVKKPNKTIPLAKVMLKQYPAMVQAMADRHIMYNNEVAYVKQREDAGEAFVIRPPEPLGINGIERNPDELERVYQMGRKACLDVLDKLKEYMK